MLSQKRILICPLDWGLGHATRCIPIIRLLIKKNAQVIIAADGRSLQLLILEFPNLEYVELGGYNINYPSGGSMMLKMFFSIPKIVSGIRREHLALTKIITDKKIDIVISDNRFGLWNKKVKSIFITHQLLIKSPFAERLLHRINLFFIKNYDECWVPDFEGSFNLSGELSHTYVLPENAYFIGALSRFESSTSISKNEYDIMAIVSGPEPQRTIFEKLIINQIRQTKLNALIVCGRTEIEQTREVIENTTIVSHLQSNEMREAILKSSIVIARSGYSTIMDLATLGKKAVFIPTPGQTEQEYLATLMMQRGVAFTQMQSALDLQAAILESEKYIGFATFENANELEKRIDALLN
jgi:predicted glycosyltransferase